MLLPSQHVDLIVDDRLRAIISVFLQSQTVIPPIRSHTGALLFANDCTQYHLPLKGKPRGRENSIFFPKTNGGPSSQISARLRRTYDSHVIQQEQLINFY